MTIDNELEKTIDRIGEQITKTIKKTIEANDCSNELKGYQVKLEDGTIYQIPFKIIKTTEQRSYDRCMMINANIIRKTELLEKIRHELVSITGLKATDKWDWRDGFNIIAIEDDVIDLDYSKLINDIDSEIDRNKDVE